MQHSKKTSVLKSIGWGFLGLAFLVGATGLAVIAVPLLTPLISPVGAACVAGGILVGGICAALSCIGKAKKACFPSAAKSTAIQDLKKPLLPKTTDATVNNRLSVSSAPKPIKNPEAPKPNPINKPSSVQENELSPVSILTPLHQEPYSPQEDISPASSNLSITPIEDSLSFDGQKPTFSLP